MVTIRSVNEIILSLIDFYRLAQPDLDTKPGTVARDLFVDGPSSQLALLYDELSGVSNQQSMRLVVGTDLDKLAKNFGVVRKQSTPSTGVALLTFSAINAPIGINKGDTVVANNGFSYSIAAGISVTPASANFYRSVASKFSSQLAFVGITDQFAVEVTVVATTAGTAGNVGAYSLNQSNIPGVSNVTNINSFSGGTDQENDATFRNRVLASFSGSSVGTTLGYLNVALGTTGVSDAAVIGPGNPLMTRDGTITTAAADGTLTIVSEGTGGKVDVVVLGANLVQNTDSFIYQDKSNNNDPTSVKNNVVLGQISADLNKTINQKRLDDIANGQLPAQPVDTILQVTGSVSGANFLPMTTDSFGRVSGNFQLLKDTGVYGGSPFGFDTFHWVSNKITNFSEDRIKGQYNGQDTTTFTDVLQVPEVQQNLAITNENSTVTSDRSIIQLLHTPATNVTRVFNVNTGERYIITNQNFDNTGTFNTTGRIQISGNTLPAPSDTLQVDYSWIVSYDRYSDYDGLVNSLNPRPVTDSVDWGLGNAIKNELVSFSDSGNPNFFQGTVSHPVDTVISAKKFLEIDGTVTQVTSGTFVNRLAVVFTNLAVVTTSVDSIVLKNTNEEVYATAQGDGNVANTTIVVGIQLLNQTTVVLPSDTTAQAGDRVTGILNSVDVFYSTLTQGSSSANQITIPSSLVNTSAGTINLDVTYITSLSDLFSSATTSLPTSRVGNGYFLNSNVGFNNFSPVNIFRRENQIVQKNLSNQILIELNLPSTDFSLIGSQILSVVRLSDGLEIWTPDNQGTIVIGSDGNYQLIFSGINTPVSGDRVLAVYQATDIRRFQPFSFTNEIIKYRIDKLAIDPATGKFTVAINKPEAQSGVNFCVIEPNTDIVLFSITDGYVSPNADGTATLSSLSVNFDTLADLTNKKIKIYGSSLLGQTTFNNNGQWDILSYDVVTNKITIGEGLSKVTPDQISIIRLLDGQEVWNYTGTIDVTDNKVLFPVVPPAAVGDSVVVMFFEFDSLRRGPTRITGTIADQIINTGIVTAAGTTLADAQNIVFTATNTGLKLNLAEAMRTALNLSSSATLPTNVRIARIIKVEKVVTASVTDNTVLEVLVTYDTTNTTIQNNLLYSNDMIADPTLANTEFVLPATSNNTQNVQTHNLPSIGDKIRVTFYYTTDNDQESLSYTRNGTLYTNKKFAFINKIYVASGFTASQSTKFTATSFTQPSLGARYKVFYDYLAPKQNERIVVNYNYNKLVSDVTFNLEETRPINADVLAREAKLVQLDLTMNVVIDPNFTSSTTTVLQNLRNQLTSALTTTTLGLTVDQPTLINVAQAVQGISRARILYFNKTGAAGSVQKIVAQEDEFFEPNNIVINTETR
jgi:uncharacterized phage protein gp47/JayE